MYNSNSDSSSDHDKKRREEQQQKMVGNIPNQGLPHHNHYQWGYQSKGYPHYQYPIDQSQYQYYYQQQQQYPHYYYQQQQGNYPGNVNQQPNYNNCFQQGRRMGRGRGRFHNHQQKTDWNTKHKDRDQRKKHRHHKCKRSSSSSSSSDSRDLSSLSKQMDNLSMKPKKQSKMIKVQQFQQQLSPFLQRYAVPQHITNKLINYLLKRYDSPDDLVYLKQTLADMEHQSPHYFQPNGINFCKISKQIIKNSFDIKKINGKLDKILFIKNKRTKKDIQFYSKYPNPISIKFLQKEELLQINHAQTIFLVDGNNLMQKQKIFRFYFDSKEDEKKSQGQIRLQWLMGQSINGQVFFDNKYKDIYYQKIKTSILDQEALENTNRIDVHFADKHLMEGATADDKIVQRLTDIVIKKQYQGKLIILVTADRQLAQRCIQIAPIMQTSGQFFFKFCKQMIKGKYYTRPQMKGIIKRIFTTRDS